MGLQIECCNGRAFRYQKGHPGRSLWLASGSRRVGEMCVSLLLVRVYVWFPVEWLATTYGVSRDGQTPRATGHGFGVRTGVQQ